jgi:hypothetical protein
MTGQLSKPASNLRKPGFFSAAFSRAADWLCETAAMLSPRSAHSGRALTKNEIALARGYFGDEIDYGRVRVHSARMHYGAFVSGNHLVFSKKLGACGDLAQSGANLFQSVEHRALFIHEMTHIWQAQKQPRSLAKLKAGFLRAAGRDPYAYDVNDETKFMDYGIEQQARLMQDFCRAHEYKKLGQAGDDAVRLVGLDEDENYPAFVKKIGPVFPAAMRSHMRP